ncbi:hypothetical protein C0992_007444 [Termitomyces sp. T32_za158]|nr:hypothetical protein C0992_007444 [Termitomyces sp. T32_za158]
MAKRKVKLEDFVEEDEGTRPSKRSQKQKNRNESDSDYSVKEETDRTYESAQDEPVFKKLKGEKKVIEDEITVKTTPDGDKYVSLGKKKRATVRSFKGTPLIDIREFYGNEGDEKPGKKGISLTVEQWETLKKSTEILDDLLAGIKRK